MSTHSFVIEIAGFAVGVARQVQGLQSNPGPPNRGIGGLTAGAPVQLAGAGARFSGQAFVSGVTHNIGGGSWGTSGRLSAASLVKVVLLGVVPLDPRGAGELSRWWGQQGSPESGRRAVSIVQQDSAGRELRRHSMDSWLVAWQGPPPAPGRPDPPPEVARVELTAANVRLGR
jgi:hypothetical protein